MSLRCSLTWVVSTAAVGAAAAPGKPAVEICGNGPAVTRPPSMILTCADDGELATHLTWSSWNATRAAASGIVTWRTGAADFASSTKWDQTRAEVVLTDPVAEPGHQTLFTQLELHVTGATPKGFMRDLKFDEAPTPPVPASAPQASPPKTAPAAPAAPSGTLSYADIEGFWIDAGGPTNSTGGFTDPQIAAAIAGAESSFLPGNIQPGVDYCDAGSDRAGWGLWQITCGNSVSQFGTDFQLLDPWNNAEAAVFKCEADIAIGDNCFDPWTTYTSGTYASFLQSTAPNTTPAAGRVPARSQAAPSKTLMPLSLARTRSAPGRMPTRSKSASACLSFSMPSFRRSRRAGRGLRPLPGRQSRSSGSARRGIYRIRYRFDDKAVTILNIKPRATAYRG